MLNPFTPGATVSRSVTGTTACVAMHFRQSGAHQSAAGNIAFIRFGGSTVEAAVTDVPILPGTVEVFTIQPSMTNVAAIGTVGTTLYFTAGDGQ